MEGKNVKGVIKRLIVLSIVFISMQNFVQAKSKKFYIDTVSVYECELIDTSFVNTIIEKTKDNYRYFHKKKLQYIFFSKEENFIRTYSYTYYSSIELLYFQPYNLKHDSFLNYNGYVLFFINENSDWSKVIQEKNLIKLPVMVTVSYDDITDAGIILILDNNLNEIEAEDCGRQIKDWFKKNKRNYRKW